MRPPTRATSAGYLVALLAAAASMPSAGAETPRVGGGHSLAEEPYATGWSFYTDNDFLSAGLSDDQGYTGGFALSLSGRRAIEYPWSLNPVVGWLDRTSGWASLYAGEPYTYQHSWQIGTMAFTPEDTDARGPLEDQLPYAGIVFIGNTRQVRLRQRQIGYLSSFNVGVLGSGIPETIQNGLHDLSGDDPARGWDNQISAGGELTFLWRLQRRQTHWSRRSRDRLDFELNSVLSASVGYSTQVSAGLTGRWGDFSTPWWSFNPDFAENISLGAPGQSHGASELYLWGGVHLREQLYNAFLEGQFRDSAVTFDRSRELESTLWEVNVGATWGMRNGYHVTLALRAGERELLDGDGQRPAWGSLIVGREF